MPIDIVAKLKVMEEMEKDGRWAELKAELVTLSYFALDNWANTEIRIRTAALAKGYKDGWISHRIRELHTAKLKAVTDERARNGPPEEMPLDMVQGMLREGFGNEHDGSTKSFRARLWKRLDQLTGGSRPRAGGHYPDQG